jgi:hypothetical protein
VGPIVVPWGIPFSLAHLVSKSGAYSIYIQANEELKPEKTQNLKNYKKWGTFHVKKL